MQFMKRTNNLVKRLCWPKGLMVLEFKILDKIDENLELKWLKPKPKKIYQFIMMNSWIWSNKCYDNQVKHRNQIIKSHLNRFMSRILDLHIK